MNKKIRFSSIVLLIAILVLSLTSTGFASNSQEAEIDIVIDEYQYDPELGHTIGTGTFTLSVGEVEITGDADAAWWNDLYVKKATTKFELTSVQGNVLFIRANFLFRGTEDDCGPGTWSITGGTGVFEDWRGNGEMVVCKDPITQRLNITLTGPIHTKTH